MRVKICGITSTGDAQAAVDAGADAIGLNFVGGPRMIDADTAQEILNSLPPMVTPVALVRIEEDLLDDALAHMLGEFWVSQVQVYGDVTPRGLALLTQDGFRPIPVVAVRDAGFAEQVASLRNSAWGYPPEAVLLDAHAPDQEGGTGRTFRWDWVSAARAEGRLPDRPRIILAGGLTPDNVAEAARVVRPFAVDVSSGVEVDGKPGRKDPDKMRAFVHHAQHAGGGSGS